MEDFKFMLTAHCLVFAVGLISLSLGVSIVLKAKIHEDKGTLIARIFGNLIVVLSLLVLLCSFYSSWQTTQLAKKHMFITNVMSENKELIDILRHDSDMRDMMMQRMMMQKMKMHEQQPMLAPGLVPNSAMPKPNMVHDNNVVIPPPPVVLPPTAPEVAR